MSSSQPPSQTPAGPAEGRRGDLRSARRAILGLLAEGLAEDLDAELADVGRKIAEVRTLVEVLQERSHTPEIEALAARAAEAADALGPIRQTAARVRAAIEPSPPERLDLARVAADALALVAPRLRKLRVDVRLEAAEGGFVVGRRSDLIQLFVHLLLAAAGAVDGAVGPRSDPTILVPRSLAVHVNRSGGHEVISLEDAGEDGTGARPSFFDAELGADHDIDLRLIRQIVVAHEGHIELDPAATGASIRVVLPAASSAAERKAARSPEPSRVAPGGARPLLLWIDADDLFLEIMVQSLPELDVRVAGTAAEALQILAFGPKPALVFCNVQLPDRSGHDLHAELAARNPALSERFVFVSDGIMTPEQVGYLIASRRPTLVRPVEVGRVRALLAGDRGAPAHAYGAPTLVEPTLVAPSAPADDDEPRASSSRLTTEYEPPTPRTGTLPVAHARVTVDSDPPRTPSTHGATMLPAEPSAPSSGQPASAIARALVAHVRRCGPMRTAAIIAMLHERGLSWAEALSVVSFALSSGALVRDPPASSILRAAGTARRRTVLVVDDDFDLRATLSDVLSDEGYRVETASNGLEALQILRTSGAPEVVVLDLMMPVMDGWRFLDELARDEILARTPVVVISAGKVPPAAGAAREFLVKPLDYDKLVGAIDRSVSLGS